MPVELPQQLPLHLQHLLGRSKDLLQHLQELLQHHGQHVQQHVLARVQDIAQALAPDQQDVELLTRVAMQHWLAATACAACLGLLLATIAAGWFALWHTTMKDVGFFREIMGLNRPRPEVKAQRQASMAAEIEKIKRQHSRSASRSLAARQTGSRPA